MLNSDALHSFIASPMQAERSSAEGLNSERAVLGSATIVRPTTAITLQSVFMTFPSVRSGVDDDNLRTRGGAAMIAVTKSRFTWPEQPSWNGSRSNQWLYEDGGTDSTVL
jgi:hypothetical protein